MGTFDRWLQKKFIFCIWSILFYNFLGSVRNRNLSTKVDNKGQELWLSASITATKQANKYLIRVDSTIANGSLSLIATWMGGKTLGFRVNTADDRGYALRTSNNLKEFALVFKYNGELLDKIQMN